MKLSWVLKTENPEKGQSKHGGGKLLLTSARHGSAKLIMKIKVMDLNLTRKYHPPGIMDIKCEFFFSNVLIVIFLSLIRRQFHEKYSAYKN